MVRPKSRCTIAKHHISGRTTGLKLCPHEVHVGSNVGKVLAITGTEIVEVGLVSTKDSDRSPNERWGAMDTGYVSQNIYLACTALGLKTVARGTMDFDTLKRELKLADTSYLELNHPIGY